jgi:cobalamin biosynthesis Mg chelatase CobN
MRNIASIPFYICLLCLLLLACSSCGFVHKVFSKHKISLDSIVTTVSDTSSAHKFEGTHVQKKEEAKSDDVQIEFSDTAQSTVNITVDSNGTKHIQAKGKIKSVKTKGTKSKLSSDSTNLQASDTSHSTSAKAVVVSKKEKETGREKHSWQVPWYGYVIFILFFLAIAAFAYIRYRARVLAKINEVKNSIHA